MAVVFTNQRRTEIVERVRRNGAVVASELAAEWDVSEDTIRRDLRDLAGEGRIQRVHGGAISLAPAAADYAARTAVAPDSKLAVARTAVGLIRPGQTVFLDGGTTTAAICRCLPVSLEITVVTHAPTVALELIDRPAVRILLVGGTLYRHSRVAVGALATEYINTLQVDVFFMGVTGVHPVHGLTTGDAEEAAIKRSIARRAIDTYVLASSEKVGTASAYKVVDLAQVTAAITDEQRTRTLTELRRAGLTVIRATPSTRVP